MNGDSPRIHATATGIHSAGVGNSPKVASKVVPAAKEENGEDRLVHSNSEIQVLLDRYHRLCQEQLPQEAEATATASGGGGPVWDKNDRRSPSRAVFSNNLVDLSRVEVVGFDYDYTLATCKHSSSSTSTFTAKYA